MTQAQDEVLNRCTGEFKRLVSVIGVENALLVAREFGGLTISIPKLDYIVRGRRDREIREAYDGGAPVKRLSRSYKLTERQVYNILGEKKRGTCGK